MLARLLVAGTIIAIVPLAVAAEPVPPPAAQGADVESRLRAKNEELLKCQDEIRRLESSLGWADRWEKRLSRMAPATSGGWLWLVLGIGGEFVFFMRFVVQWWASERRKRTVVPMMFWHLSLVGTGLVLAYALYRIDPVFILAYSLNVFIYVRNLMIARRNPAMETVEEKLSE